jgi:hypothetical protein
MSATNDDSTKQLLSIKGFQELVRIVDATVHAIDPEGVVTGIGTMQTIQGLLQRDGLKQRLGQDFCDFIEQQYNESQQPDTHKFKPNVREYVKKILVYPNITPSSDWTDIAITSEEHQQLDVIASKLRFQLKIIDEKVYAVPVPGNNAIDYRIQILNLFKHAIHPVHVIANPEPQHIAVIDDANIVKECGLENVTSFITKFNQTKDSIIHIAFDKIKTTVSEDWSLSSRCYLVGINSLELTEFIKQFNETFKNMFKPSTHASFAVLPRSLHLF